MTTQPSRKPNARGQSVSTLTDITSTDRKVVCAGDIQWTDIHDTQDSIAAFRAYLRDASRPDNGAPVAFATGFRARLKQAEDLRLLTPQWMEALAPEVSTAYAAVFGKGCRVRARVARALGIGRSELVLGLLLLQVLTVTPDFRGMGIGSAFISELLDATTTSADIAVVDLDQVGKTEGKPIARYLRRFDFRHVPDSNCLALSLRNHDRRPA